MSKEDDADRDRVFALLDSLSTEIDVDSNFAAAPMAAEHDATTVFAWLDEIGARVSTRLIMSPLIAVLLGADMREVSMLYLLHYIQTAGQFPCTVVSARQAELDRRLEQLDRIGQDWGSVPADATWQSDHVHMDGQVCSSTRVGACRYSCLGHPPRWLS